MIIRRLGEWTPLKYVHVHDCSLECASRIHRSETLLTSGESSLFVPPAREVRSTLSRGFEQTRSETCTFWKRGVYSRINRHDW